MFRINFLKLIRKRRKTSKNAYKRRFRRCAAISGLPHLRLVNCGARFFVRLKYARFYAFFTFIINTIIEVPLRHLFAPKFRERVPHLRQANCGLRSFFYPPALCVFWSTDDRQPSTDCGRGAPEKKDMENRSLVFPVLLVSPVFPVTLVTLVTPVTPVTLAPPCSRVSFLIPASLIGLLLCYI